MIVQALLVSMPSRGASDLFLSEGKIPAVRRHGRVVPLDMPQTTEADFETFLREHIGEIARRRFLSTGDMDVGLTIDGIRFRVNLAREQGGQALTARAVHAGSLEVSELGLPIGVSRLADHQRGLVLVTGATGSGKSTTLAAMIERVNRTRQAHIVTIEDPVEYVFEERLARIMQREVGDDTDSFHAALRAVVRQSPDVILLGEIRDAETVRVALSAALTGHLVLASLHTINATQSLQRLLSYFPDHLRAQVAIDLSLSLRGVVSQRLLPRKDKAGRVAAVELMTVTPAVKKLLRDQRAEELYDLMRSVRGDECITFNRAILRLHQDGIVDYETGLAHSSNPDEFALQARGMSTGVASFAQSGVGRAASKELDMKTLLGEVLDRGASDLHLSVDRPPILRIQGDLVPISDRALSEADMRLLLNSILSGRQRSIYELEREIDFALALENGRRFRVNAYFQKGRMAAALRAIPSHIPDPDELGLPATVLELGRRPQGLLLVVGPTGSGKSTTLACLVDQINRERACRIITIEDPIEYTHVGVKATIDQREVYSDTMSFGAALKYILRQDPDVILVGEMRDAETISAAMTAAETGHLVLATLHSNDAIGAIDRIVDTFPPHQQDQARSQLASSLLAVVSQRLLRNKDETGRVPAFEILIATPAVRNIIRDDKQHQAQTIMQRSRREGMITMDQYLKALMDAEQISKTEAMRYTTNPMSLGG
jgi:pilus retraction protein PilT